MLLNVDPSLLTANFPSQPFKVGHGLCGHPLFALDRLLELARQLPAKSVEYNAGDLPVNQDPTSTPMTGLSAEETIRRIAEHKSWMVLKNVEQVADFRRLLDDCIDQIEPLCAPITPHVQLREGYVFLSSPGAVTPYHMDDEHNFLLQLRGSKTVQTWDGDNPDVLGWRDLERFYGGSHRNLPYRDTLTPLAMGHDLGPGDGLHIPLHSPHWVEVGDEVSISFSITFRSRGSQKAAAVHWFNAKLRERGLDLRPFGRSVLGDEAKYLAARAVRRTLRVTRGG